MRAIALALIVLLGVAATTEYFEVGHHRAVVREAKTWSRGDPQRGQAKIIEYGCVACHDLPDRRGTRPHIGPPLGGFRQREYIGGMLENKGDNLIAFIRNPRAVVPHGAMPNLGVKEQDARDIAAYLYTLE